MIDQDPIKLKSKTKALEFKFKFLKDVTKRLKLLVIDYKPCVIDYRL